MITVFVYEYFTKIFKDVMFAPIIAGIILWAPMIFISYMRIGEIKPTFEYFNMFTLGYIPLIAIFVYVVLIICIKGLILSLYKKEKDIKKRDKKNDKTTNSKSKLELKNMNNICKNIINTICNICIKYVYIVNIVVLTIIVGLFTYIIDIHILDSTLLGYIDVTKGKVYTIDKSLKEEITNLRNDISDITIKYSVYPYADEISKEKKEKLKENNNNSNENGEEQQDQTQNERGNYITNNRYDIENRIYNVIDIVSKEISKKNKKIKYEYIKDSTDLKLQIQYTKNGEKNNYEIPLQNIIFQDLNSYRIYSRVQEIYTDFFKNVNQDDNKNTYGLIEEDANILKRQDLAPIIDNVVENDMSLETITNDNFKDISINKYRTIIIPARKEDISQELLDILMKFKEDGGNFLFFKMPTQEKKPEFERLDKLISEYGIHVPNNNLVLEQDNNHRMYVSNGKEKYIDNTIMIPDTTSDTNITKMYDTIKSGQRFVTATNGNIIKDSDEELKQKKVVINDIVKTSVNAKTVDSYVKEEITAETIERRRTWKCITSEQK
mgnify:FL=1